MASVGVIVAVAGRDEAGIAAAIDAHPRLTVARRCADLAEAVAAAQAGVAGAAVVSDQPHLTRASMAALSASGVVVVGVAPHADASAQLSSLGATSIAAPGSPPEAVADHVARALSAHVEAEVSEPVTPKPAERSGSITVVWGPTGAPGRTTIATSIAFEHAREGARTLLVDADTYGGAVAQSVGLTDEAAGLAGAVREAQHGAVDAAVLHRYAVRLSEDLWVLSGITRPERWPELAGGAVEEVLRAARASFDRVVVDVGFSLDADESLQYDTRAPLRNGATLAAVRAADHVVAVGSAEPVGMQRLIHGLARLRETVDGEPVVVVNKVRAGVAGPRPAEAVADLLARFADVEHAFVVPWDPDACDAAALTGRALAECAPRSRARRAILTVAHMLAPTASAAPRRPRIVAAAMGH